MEIRRKVAAVACATVVMTAMSTGVAHAATPAVQGCVGDTFAGHKSPAFGAVVIRPFAQDPTNRPGLGDGIQALQAGAVPDEVAANACNP